MKLDDLKHVFKSSTCAPMDAKSYIVNLLNKFEVALTWDNRTLLIPSLLPSEEQLRSGLPGMDVRVKVLTVPGGKSPTPFLCFKLEFLLFKGFCLLGFHLIIFIRNSFIYLIFSLALLLMTLSVHFKPFPWFSSILVV